MCEATGKENALIDFEMLRVGEMDRPCIHCIHEGGGLFGRAQFGRQ